MTFSDGLSTIPGFENAANKMFEVLDSANERIISQQLDNLGKSKAAAAAVVEEFGKAKDKTTLFKEDFFGAEEASERMNEKFKELEGSGKKVREDFMEANASTEEVKKNTSAAVSDADAIAGSFNKAEGSTAKIKETLSESAKLLKDITDAESKDQVDKGGRLEKQAQQQMERGDFSAARATASLMREREIEASIRGTGNNKDIRSMRDIGADFGLSPQLGESGTEFARRVKDVREGYAKAEKFGKSTPIPGVDRPGQDGSKTEPSAKDGNNSKPASLDGLVGNILECVKNIERKLPVAALVA
jgi:hypothetical protein